jgi:molecular chaperone DnaJ
MADSTTHYQTLEIPPSASQDEIKQAYRRLAKKFHPDRNQADDSQEVIQQINAAYEVLSDPLSRRSYDQGLRYIPCYPTRAADRQERSAAAHSQYRQQRQAEQDTEILLERWLRQVYTPINRLLNQMIKPLKGQIKALSADPFDDDLMATFQAYLEDCRTDLSKAQALLKKLPNPATAAGVAANLYYCINQLGDALGELETFTMNYDETYLHDGLEMFRIAQGLRKEAQVAVRQLA